jgi:bis(5'-nucleosidyl)-tetraphosphatase
MPYALNKKTTSEAKSKPKLIIEKSAGAVVFYRDAQVEYLLLRANHWEFPKGLVDANESEQDTAVREVREETGLEIKLLPNFRETIQYFYRRKENG